MFDLDDLVARVSAKIKANGGITPSRVLRGYSWHIDEATVDPNCDLTDKQTEDAIEWLIAEVNTLLPDYADWNSDTSEIIVPIDKVQEFTETVDWDALCEQAWENFVENYEVK